MKIFPKIIFSILLASSAFAQEWDEDGWASTYATMAAFEYRADGNPLLFGRPGYVKPIIDNLGNVLNSNWYTSASIAKSPAFEVGLPFSLIFINDDDKTFNEFGMESPTIFGGHADMGHPETLLDGPMVYGNKTLSNLGVFTYPYLQLGGSFYHARIVFRGMFLPAISELQSFSLFGVGAQYSFGHLFRDKLPAAAKPLDVSLVFGYSTSGISYQPEDFRGTLDLDITAVTVDAVFGYRPVAFFEVLLTLGYQYANMESSGLMVSEDPNHPGDVIKPNVSVKGNNGFKFGLELAFSVGTSFHPVVGFDYAGKSSFTTNVLYFKQQFGKDEDEKPAAKAEKAKEPEVESTDDSDEEAANNGSAEPEESEDDEGYEE